LWLETASITAGAKTLASAMCLRAVSGRHIFRRRAHKASGRDARLEVWPDFDVTIATAIASPNKCVTV
jgi:hypothetical protein